MRVVDGTVIRSRAAAGLGGAHADAADQLAGIAAGGSADSTDLLIVASTNFLDARDIYTGMDTADLSETLLSAVEGLHRYPSILDRVVDIVDDRLEPAESTILAHSGSMLSLIDELFFAPLNQQWVDVSESLLDATHAFDNAVADGSVVDVMSAEFRARGDDRRPLRRCDRARCAGLLRLRVLTLPTSQQPQQS